MGRNPKTKVKAKISARKVVKFIPSVEFKKNARNSISFVASKKLIDNIFN